MATSNKPKNRTDADTVDFKALPSPATIRVWWVQAVEAIEAASGSPEKCHLCIMEVRARSRTPLADVGDFETLHNTIKTDIPQGSV